MSHIPLRNIESLQTVRVHYLHVASVQVVPHVGGDDVPQPVQVLLAAEVLQGPVAPGHVLLNSVEVEAEGVEQLLVVHSSLRGCRGGAGGGHCRPQEVRL